MTPIAIDFADDAEDTNPGAPPPQSIGARVEVSILINGRDGAVPRPAFGRIVALDQVAVVVDGENEARAFEPGKVRVL